MLALWSVNGGFVLGGPPDGLEMGIRGGPGPGGGLLLGVRGPGPRSGLLPGGAGGLTDPCGQPGGGGGGELIPG